MSWATPLNNVAGIDMGSPLRQQEDVLKSLIFLNSGFCRQNDQSKSVCWKQNKSFTFGNSVNWNYLMLEIIIFVVLAVVICCCCCCKLQRNTITNEDLLCFNLFKLFSIFCFFFVFNILICLLLLFCFLFLLFILFVNN